MKQGLNHKFLLSLPIELYTRIREHMYPLGKYSTATALILDALEQHISTLDGVLPGFRSAWSASHFGMFPEPRDRHLCYAAPMGSAAEFTTHVHGPQFLLSELEQHYRRDLWNERTAQLIREHIRLWKARGVAVPEPPMLPPGWDLAPQGDTPDAWAAAAVRAPTDAPHSDGDIE